jgi:L-cysteine:1D-myo-inositol 2-amino-2-deoxy-alpha-D-glucopyranoside ligase
VKSWNTPEIPALPGTGPVPRIFDSASRSLQPAEAATVSGDQHVASLYVCGITPYDATHLGHAATYLAYDTLIRLWLDAGYKVRYAQNVTDVDDPLLERAAQTGVDWRDLAASQINLFRSDMEQLSIVPPDHYVGVTEVIPEVAEAVRRLGELGIGYPVDSEDAAPDLYFDNAAATAASPWYLGQESNLDRATMLELSAERGGDPLRPDKRDALDPVLWRSERVSEPAWDSVVGRGRPGWHIECAVIALTFLPTPLTVNGGGSDLLFPHHEFSAAHAAALSGEPLAGIYSHAGMVAYQGEKMSKSLGNLVLVSVLTARGVDPRAIRLAILSNHYRSDWEWTDDALAVAEHRLAEWVVWAASGAKASPGETDDTDDTTLLDGLRETLASDLDTPGAIRLVDRFIASGGAASDTRIAAIDALLGIDLAAPN